MNFFSFNLFTLTSIEILSFFKSFFKKSINSFLFLFNSSLLVLFVRVYSILSFSLSSGLLIERMLSKFFLPELLIFIWNFFQDCSSDFWSNFELYVLLLSSWFIFSKAKFLITFFALSEDNESPEISFFEIKLFLV